MRKLILPLVFLSATVALALSVVKKDLVHFFTGGIQVGVNETVKRLDTCLLSNADLPTAAANVTTFVTGTCTGAALGDTCSIGPLQDDAAWDEGVLTCFVESADTVKLVYEADLTGGDPAPTNDYNVMLTRF